jgi:general stress protein YciG
MITRIIGMSDGIPRVKAKRGLACMTPERRREIASMGGLSVKPESRAFYINRELARTAGRKGGKS